MNVRHSFRAGARLAAGLVLGSSLVAQTGPSTDSTNAPVVHVAEVEAIIHPVSAEFMIDAVKGADQAGAAALVFLLRTPGGLVDSTRDIVSEMIAAKTPVIVYVAPSGARAASAGFLLTIAADVAAMAPGTHIGAAHPVSGDGQKMDETISKKSASDVAAYARSLAARRNRSVELSEQAVTESRSFTEVEALEGRLIDLIATDVPDLLAKLEGRSMTRFDGRTVVLHTAGAAITSVEMTVRQRVLSAIAHPQIAYLLFTLGTLGLTIELWNPGSILPGVVGGLCLLLAFFAFQILPVNYVGLLLMLFGLVLLLLEIKVTSFGLLATGGIASLILGSVMLIDSPLPELQIGLSLILPMATAMGAVLLFLARIALKAQLRPSETGESGMIAGIGQTLAAISPDQPGRVSIHGEIWNAVAPGPIGVGESVRVTAIHGLTLSVERATRADREETP